MTSKSDMTMESPEILHQIDILRVKGGRTIPMKDLIIDEDVLQIFINGEKTFEMVFSMTHTRALAAGFLFTQGIIKDKKDIEDIHFDETQKQCHVRMHPGAADRLERFRQKRQVKGSSGGILLKGNMIPAKADSLPDFTLTPDQVLYLIAEHWNASRLFHQTGAVHSAGLCTPKKLVHYYEDIGRHNALDKLAGAILLEEINPLDKVATVSCRMSVEIVGKLIKTKIPVVISNAAPTLSAVQLAEQAGLTIVGFAREHRFNIYTHKQRILYPGA